MGEPLILPLTQLGRYQAYRDKCCDYLEKQWYKLVGKKSKLEGNRKSPKFQRVPKTNKIMTHFHLRRNQKHNIWTIVVLQMAKYTIISLILVDFVTIFFNLLFLLRRGEQYIHSQTSSVASIISPINMIRSSTADLCTTIVILLAMLLRIGSKGYWKTRKEQTFEEFHEQYDLTRWPGVVPQSNELHNIS